MRISHFILRSLGRRLVLLAFAILLYGPKAVFAQPAVVDPVEEIRSILSAPVGDLPKRDRLLRQQIQAMDRLGDLARALILREWRDDDQDHRVAAIDRPNRIALTQRFEAAVRDGLRQGDDATRLAVLSMLADLGTITHGIGSKHGMARCFGPDLIELTRCANAALRATALRTLGQMDPEPGVALSAFSVQLSADDPEQRLAAADGLVCWIRTLAQLALRASEPGRTAVSQADFIAVGQAIIPVAARGLQAEQPEIRRRSVQAIGYAAAVLQNWVLAAGSLETIEDRDDFHRRLEELRPLVVALEAERMALMRALSDSDAEVRYRAGWLLEDAAIARQLVMARATSPFQAPAAVSLGSSSFVSLSNAPDHRDELPNSARVLAAQLRYGDLQARRAALDTLEAIGQEAAPALAEIVGALADPDKFVRWAAARTLGRMVPVREEGVAPRLAQLLTDEDLDVRLAAVAALERLGPAAQAAAPDLRRLVGSADTQLRLAALHALAAIGDADAPDAVSDVAAALGDADARVRLVAVQILGKFGPAAREAVPALCQALEDPSADVQRAAGEALLNILRPGQK